MIALERKESEGISSIPRSSVQLDLLKPSKMQEDRASYLEPVSLFDIDRKVACNVAKTCACLRLLKALTQESLGVDRQGHVERRLLGRRRKDPFSRFWQDPKCIAPLRREYMLRHWIYTMQMTRFIYNGKISLELTHYHTSSTLSSGQKNHAVVIRTLMPPAIQRSTCILPVT